MKHRIGHIRPALGDDVGKISAGCVVILTYLAEFCHYHQKAA